MNALNGYLVLGKTGMPIGLGTAIVPGSGQTAVLYDSTKESTARGQLSSSNQGARFKGVVLNVEASADSAANGMEISESDDNGGNWSRVAFHSYSAAGDGRYKMPVYIVSAPDFRVRYINSANVLSFFRWSLIADRFERAV